MTCLSSSLAGALRTGLTTTHHKGLSLLASASAAVSGREGRETAHSLESELLEVSVVLQDRTGCQLLLHSLPPARIA